MKSGNQARQSMVAPYTVMHVQEEVKEVEMVIKVIEILREISGQKPSTAVITFYAKQRQVISLELQTKKLSNSEVNTLEGFRGSERDIIILSCGGGGLEDGGLPQESQDLSVALTRARYSLVVLGNMEKMQVSG